MPRVFIKPELLRWARERAGMTLDDLANRFAKLPEWESGETQPTLKQLEAFARVVHVPFGYLFLAEPPQESAPIPDFRTLAGQAVTRPSPDLLDMIYACQERQAWYRDFARSTWQPELGFVGSATMETEPETAAARISETLDFASTARRQCPTWSDALRLFIRKAEDVGVLVMVSGVVGSNNHRPLDPGEFRGFALSDPLAPLVFVNGADTKAAQMFTLAHELAHLWLGASALSNSEALLRPGFSREEVWCNAVAAELLLPLVDLRPELRDDEDLPEALSRLAQSFKVSTLVILRRLLDAGRLDRRLFDIAWEQEIARFRKPTQPGGGGDFYRTTLARVSHRFARAVVGSAKEGHTLYRDAFRMLGVSKTETLNRLGREAGPMA